MYVRRTGRHTLVTPDGAILSADVKQREGTVPSRAPRLQPHNYNPFLHKALMPPIRRDFSKLTDARRNKTTVKYEDVSPMNRCRYVTKHVPGQK